MKNQEIAKVLYKIANILEIQDVEWKPRAYRRAAQSIETLGEDIEDLYREGRLEEIPGVGKNIAKKIEEILKTGHLRYLNKLNKKVPLVLQKLMNIQGIGPKTVKTIQRELRIKTINDLKKAINQHKIRSIKGLGEKTEESILEGIKELEVSDHRFLLGLFLPVAKDIEDRLRRLSFVQNVDVAGSVRRMKETIHDVDILVATKEPIKVINFFTNMKDVKEVLAKGTTKASIILDNGLQVDLRVINIESYGSALQYFTGSKLHSIELRKIAMKKGLKLSEYGIFKGKKKLVSRTEEDVYKSLGLKYIEPELREDNGEIEAALKNKLPRLVSLNDIKGDLHMHTNWSDGNNTIEEMAKAAKKLNYEYIAITDHSRARAIAHGLKEDDIIRQINEIRKSEKKVKGIKIFTGNEVDILADGTLDLNDNILKKLDVVIAAIHSGFKMSERQMTERIIKALENKYVKILDHPTGRLINKRKPYAIDLEQIYDVAKEKKKILEINCMPDRLDLNDVNIKRAIEKGVKLIIGTDSHRVDHLRYMGLGVAQARRGWATKKDIFNTLSLKDIKKYIL